MTDPDYWPVWTGDPRDRFAREAIDAALNAMLAQMKFLGGSPGGRRGRLPIRARASAPSEAGVPAMTDKPAGTGHPPNLKQRRRYGRWFLTLGCLALAIDLVWQLIIWRTIPFEGTFLGTAIWCWIQSAREYGFVRGARAQAAWHQSTRLEGHDR